MSYIKRYMDMINNREQEKSRSISPEGYYDALPALKELQDEVYDLSVSGDIEIFDENLNAYKANKEYIDSFLLDLALLGDMAENLLRELTDSDSIDANKYDYLDREGEQ